MAALNPDDRAALLSKLTEEECESLLFDWSGFLARPDQLPPSGDWDIWMTLTGRGWGKTRTGAEWVRQQVDAGCMRIALIGETQKDLEKVMIEGESGLLSVFPKSDMPGYVKKPVEVRFKTGAIALGFNATEPEQLRGHQFDAAWGDELAKWRYARDTWDQLQFCLRLGDDPKTFISTTPKPIPLIKDIIAGHEGKAIIVRGSTKDNESNLAPKFIKKIYKKYDGTRLGRQELRAEILADIPNALWTDATLEVSRVSAQPDQLGRIVVSIDPATGEEDNEDGNEHGIIVVGLSEDGKEAYVLEDGTIRGAPLDWANKGIMLYDKYQADCIVAEVNQGGAMVSQTIRTVRNNVPIQTVWAKRKKHVRAEPIASLYSQGRVHHVGAFSVLEGQMTQMTTAGYQGEGSPDRCDALVWALTKLFPDMVNEPKKTEVKVIPVKHWWNQNGR